ncbi:hypothetical protein WPS_26580 [Vulcanimicrobium alpinum]|uniref:Uncharacterized protein n=1 Tax=Vulcanimicrobium alpinum TaxID=3016050 RepID=A0AAN1XXU0_UNVUL|nr:hypothetical protein WPS_26580 [Vulcanimicrobium alpinum]
MLFKLVDHPRFAGFVTNAIYERDGVVLEFLMNWTPHDPADVEAGPWEAALRAGVAGTKALAEAG